ncbi:MAG: hypothetical protein RLZZ65_1498 [Bacteroidota bacterium]|jgi:hypothetical protein
MVLAFNSNSLCILQPQAQSAQPDLIPIDQERPLIKERLNSILQEYVAKTPISRITWFAPDFTLFPNDLFDAQALLSYYELNHGPLAPQLSLHFDLIENLDIVLIYTVPTWLSDYCKNDLKFLRLQHEVSLQLHYLATQKNLAQIPVFFHENQFVLSVFQQNQLLSCTANAFQQESDFIYFLLAHQQKLKLNPAFHLRLFATSPAAQLDQIKALLSKFKDFEALQIELISYQTYQNQLLCGSLEAH